MYWLFNLRKFYVVGQRSQKLSWRQMRSFRGNQGDQIVFYEFSGKNKFFRYLYNIEQIEVNQIIKNVNINEGFQISLTIELQEDFGYKKEIPDYIFSFPRIIYFNKFLYRHFNRKYYLLSEYEFNAIVKDEIFEARSVIGVVLNSMHIDHRTAFIELLIENIPAVLQNRYNHAEILNLLNEYIEYSITVPSFQLTESYEIIEKLLPDDIKGQLGFADAGLNSPADNIRRQVGIIRENIPVIMENLTIVDIAYKTDLKFERTFRNRPLPIDLIQ